MIADSLDETSTDHHPDRAGVSITIGTNYTMQNRSPRSVFVEVAAAAPTDSGGAFVMSPAPGAGSAGIAKANFGDSIYVWTAAATGGAVVSTTRLPRCPFAFGGTGTGGGGGGLHFRNPADSFNGSDLAAARLARDTYFALPANVGALREFQGDRTLAIILTITGSSTRDFETYLGNPGDAYDNTQWVPRTDAIQGGRGGQGRFELVIHTNSAAQPTPNIPTGGSYDIDSGVLTPPAGTTEHPTPPGTGEDVWASEAAINPSIQSGSVTPVWSEWVERSHLSSGISHVEHSAELGGLGTVADPLTIGASITRDSELADLVADVTGAGFDITVTNQDGSTTDFSIPDDLVDVTNTGLPALTIDNYRKLFIDHDTPRVWVGHREPVPGTPASGTFNAYTDSDYFGVRTNNPTTAPSGSDHYYNRTIHAWRGRTTTTGFPPRTIWGTRSFNSIFGGNSTWLGEQPDDATAANLVQNFSATHAYYYYNIGGQRVDLLDNSTYVAPVNPSDHYTAEPISAPTGVGSISGVTAGVGLAGGGTSGVVSLAMDVSLASFPVIPISKGGTDATSSADARSNLGLGSAATRNVGDATGNVAVLQNNAAFLARHISPGGADGQVLTRDSSVAGMTWESQNPTVVHDGTLDGTGRTSDPLGIAPNAITPPRVEVPVDPTDGQILTYRAAGTTFAWTDPGGLTTILSDTSISGDGSASDPLSVDETGADFPVIPLDKGGTGAVGAAAARTALGLGSAAVINTGVVSGQIAILGTDNSFVVNVLAPGGSTGQVLTRTGAGKEWATFVGGQGVQGPFDITAWRADTSMPVTPAGGLYNVDTRTLFAPTGWFATAPALQTGETLYRVDARIDPAVDSGNVTPTWSVPLPWGTGQGGGLTVVTSDATLAGFGTVATPLGVAAASIDMTRLAIGNTPQANQVLSWDAVNGRLLWKDDETATLGSGITMVSHDTAFGGMGTAADPLTMNVIGLDFPTVPIQKGGTGAVTAADARTALALGSVATLDYGSGVGQIPRLGAGGVLLTGELAPGGNAMQVLTRTASGMEWINPTSPGAVSDTSLSGAGITGDPLAVDPSGADFPIIPINKGGTGATDASGARTALGLTIGTAAGNIAALGTGGVFDAARLPAGYTDADVDARLLDRLENAPSSGASFSDRFLMLDDSNPGELRSVNTGAIRNYATAPWAHPTNTSLLIPVGTLAPAGTTGQVLTRTSTGQEWEDPTGMGGGLLTVASDGTLSGDGTSLDPLGVADDSITTLQLAPLAVHTANLGLLSVHPGQLADEAVTEPKLAASNAPGTNQVLGWDGSALQWVAQTGGGGLTVSAWDTGDHLLASGISSRRTAVRSCPGRTATPATILILKHRRSTGS